MMRPIRPVRVSLIGPRAVSSVALRFQCCGVSFGAWPAMRAHADARHSQRVTPRWPVDPWGNMLDDGFAACIRKVAVGMSEEEARAFLGSSGRS